MVIRKDLVVTVLVTFCLTATLFMILPTRSLPAIGEYDPWLDTNDDGKIDMKDIGAEARAFGSFGTPINKTALLLELQTARAHSETHSETEETLSGYDWTWQNMLDMSVKIYLETNCTLLIMFSAQAKTTTGYLELSVRAIVDSTQANPPTGVTLTKLTDWATHSFTFYCPNVPPGLHTVSIQWKINDEVGSVHVMGRTLIVTALPP